MCISKIALSGIWMFVFALYIIYILVNAACSVYGRKVHGRLCGKHSSPFKGGETMKAATEAKGVCILNVSLVQAVELSIPFIKDQRASVVTLQQSIKEASAREWTTLLCVSGEEN